MSVTRSQKAQRVDCLDSLTERSNLSVSGQAANVTPRIDPHRQINLTVWARINPATNPGLAHLTESFERKHPNVHVTIVTRNHVDYPSQVKTALLGPNPPDVAQGAQGFSLDAALIKAKLIQPLDRYAEALGWLTRYSADMRRQFQMGADGNTIGSGPLWGVSEAFSPKGWFYNKKLLSAIGGRVPATLAEFEALLAQSKAAGQTPIALGDLEGSAAFLVFDAIKNQLVPVQDLNGIAYTDPAAKWNSPAFVASAQKLRDWVNNGYFENGYDRISRNEQSANFARGNTLFNLGFFYEASTIIEPRMGSNVGFFAPPPAKAGDPYRMTGSLLNPWHVSAATKNPDAAALYIDWITNAAASKHYTASGYLPVAPLSADPHPPGSLFSDIYQAYLAVLNKGAFIPYVWSLPSVGNPLGSTLQEIMAGKTSAQDGMTALQNTRESFFAQLGVPG